MAANQANELSDMLFEYLQVADSSLDELRAKQTPAIVPFFPVCGEDRVSKKLLPILMKGFPLAIILELGRENSLHILWVGCEYEALTCKRKFNSLRPPGREAAIEPPPKGQVIISR